MRVAELVAEFLAWAGRHRAVNTVKFYAGRLKPFVARFGDRDWSELLPLDLDAYLEEAGVSADGRSLSDSTRRHNAKALKSLQKFAMQQKLAAAKIFDRLEMPPMGQRERIPTEEEIDRLLEKASLAFRLVYAALTQTGARPAEICGLRIEQIDRRKGKHGLISLRAHKTARKTGKPRLIPIGSKFAMLLAVAIAGRTEGPVFLSDRRKAWTASHLSATHRELRDRAGLPRDLVLYLARHGFATRQLEAGAEIKAVADMLGHKSVKTTEKYLHRDISTLGDAQDRV